MAYYPLATEFEAFYRLVGADGVSVATFNDPLDPNYVGALTEVTGLDSADVRESASELPEADGGSHGAFYLGRRPLTLTGKVFGHASVAERTIRLDRARRASLALRGDSLLYWKPSNRNENLITNPRAQVNVSDWTATPQVGATLVRTVPSPAPPVGTTCFQMVTAGTGNTNQGYGSNLFQINAGQKYTVSIAVRRSVGTGELTVDVATPGVMVHTTVLTTGITSSWVVYSATFTATISGVAQVRCFQPNSDVNSSTLRWSDVMVTPGVNTTYRDGDTTGWFWAGAQGNSVSGDFIEMYIPVRRQGPFRETDAWVKTFQIPLVSEYAYIYGSTLKIVSGGVGAAVTGENRGNAPSYPLITITGPATDPTVSDGTRTFRTALNAIAGGALASGETVQFDMATHSGLFTAGARAGQSANRYINWATTDWPYLAGLGSTTTLTPSAGSLSVSYRDAWA